MKLISILTATMILTQTSFAQESMNYDSRLLVIAYGGLKLREGPGTQFKTIAAAPFGAEVQFIEPTGMPNDTVQRFSRKFSEEYNHHTKVQATWLKVKYGEQIGYMYSLHLFPKNRERGLLNYPELNTKYQIFSKVNGSVGENLRLTSQKYWYEIFQESDGSLSLNSIDVELLSSYLIGECREGELTWELIVQRDDSKSYSTILYSSKKLITGKLNSQPVNDFNEQLRSIEELERYNRIDREEFNTLKNKLLQRFSLKVSPNVEKKPTQSFKNNSNERLFPKDESLTSISLVADIDRDGIMDFIVTYGSLHQTNTGLYLSSEADEGNNHKLVTLFNDDNFCWE